MKSSNFLFCIVFVLSAGNALADQFNPEMPGTYPVGVTTITFVDHSRTDALTKGPRTLPTEIWYPAGEETRGLPVNRLSDFFLKNQSPELALLLLAGFGVELEEADKVFKNFAVRDARIADGIFPLILFSHGNGGMRMQNTSWCEHLASHGYIVVAPDHTGNCSVTFVNGNLTLFDSSKEARKQSAEDRPKDLSFLIDQMELLNKGNDSRFLGRVDMERIGAAGHSFGGFTCSWLINSEPRVKAIIPMAGAADERTNFDCPVMLFIATEDATLGKERMDTLRNYYDASKGPRYSIEFKDAGHFSFTEMYQLKPDFGDGVGKGTRITNGEPVDYVGMETVFPLLNGYSTAFYNKYLKRQQDGDAYLAENQNPEAVIYKHEP
ncbi:MAG TPA: dienelactone hydrolase family protein [Candidatus Hydrogenedentes bacterium]|nr:dienelactone hydrolase family protein [Candidatus Hydrogenedentota bacterium]